jgi:hypothetical protein
MRESEFDEVIAALDRAEFAVKGLREKTVELTRKRASAKTAEEIAALNLEATELKQQLRKISDAVHTGDPAPHLRLVSDTEESLVDRRQPPPRRRLLKSGEILLGKHPIPCTVRNMSERGACLQVQTTAGIPAIFDFQRAGEPDVRTCKTIWRDNTRIGVMFIQRE